MRTRISVFFGIYIIYSLLNPNEGPRSVRVHNVYHYWNFLRCIYIEIENTAIINQNKITYTRTPVLFASLIIISASIGKVCGVDLIPHILQWKYQPSRFYRFDPIFRWAISSIRTWISIKNMEIIDRRNKEPLHVFWIQ